MKICFFDAYNKENEQMQDNFNNGLSSIGNGVVEYDKELTKFDQQVQENQEQEARDEAALHDIVMINGGGSYSDGIYGSQQTSYGIDLKTFETKILETQAVGLGTPSTSANVSVTWAKSIDGWNGVTGESKNLEGSAGPASGGVSFSNSSVAATIGFSAGTSDIAALKAIL